MKVYQSRYQELSSEEQRKIKASDLFVFDGTRAVRLLDLYVSEKRNADGTNSVRKVRSVADFETNFNKHNNIFADKNASLSSHIDNMIARVVIEKVSVPEAYDSDSINITGAKEKDKIAYGLKRTLEVAQAKVGEGEYLYVLINGKGSFIKKDQVYWYDGLEEKTYEAAIKEKRDLSKIEFFNKQGGVFDGIYTEYEYNFSGIKERERANLSLTRDEENNLPPLTVRTYRFGFNGRTIFSERKIDKIISDQRFVTLEVDDEKRPGKKKKVSRIQTTNYSMSPSGNFISVVVDGEVKMVNINKIVDENGNKISDVKTMVGRSVGIKEDGGITQTSPLTFEQANLRYDTIKTYQPSSDPPSKTSCLKLANGGYAKELESVQPISFRLAGDNEKNFDKYLIEQTVGSVTKFVVIDKDYFAKRGGGKGFDQTKAKKLIRCDYNDKNCSVVQTTSKKQPVEQCALLKNIKFGEAVVEKSETTKAQLYSDFRSEYENGEYEIEYVYLNGEKVDLVEGNSRYHYSEVSYHEDYSSNLHSFKSMKTKNISIKNGKIVGGAKYSIEKGIKSGLSNWATAFLAGVSIVPWLAIFGPIGMTIVAIYDIAVLAALPLIPIVNVAIGLSVNNPLRKLIKYKDKTEHNRNKQASAIKSKLRKLVANKSLSKTQFDDVYSKLMDEISMFARTTNNNSLVVVNGNAEVDSNNANLANKYVVDYRKAKRKYDFFKKKVDKLKEKGKRIPDKLQQDYVRSKAEFDSILNTTRGQSYKHDPRLERLQNEAAAVRFYSYIKKYPESEFVSNLSQGLTQAKIKYKNGLGLTINGISINANDLTLAVRFKNDQAKIDAWKKLRIEASRAIEEAREVKAIKPEIGDVEARIDVGSQLDELVDFAELKYNSIMELIADYVDNYVIMNSYKSLVTDIFEGVKNLSNVGTSTSIEKIENIIQRINSENKILNDNMIYAIADKSSISRIESGVAEFRELETTVLEMCETLDDKAKLQYLKLLKEYTANIERAHEDGKNLGLNDEVNDLSVYGDIIAENVDKVENIVTEIKKSENLSDKNKLIAEIEEYYSKAESKISSLDATDIKKLLSSVISGLSNNKGLIKELLNDAKLENIEKDEVITLRDKAVCISELIGIVSDSLIALDDVRNKTSEKDQTFVGELIRKISEFIRINKEMSVSELQERVRSCREFYETEILLLVANIQEKKKKQEEKKSEQPTQRKVLNSNTLLAERKVMEELRDENSAIYNQMLQLLTKSSKKFKMEQEEAIAAISNFVAQVELAHKQQVYAKDVFEEDSIEKYILANAKKIMGKAVTLQL